MLTKMFKAKVIHIWRTADASNESEEEEVKDEGDDDDEEIKGPFDVTYSTFLF